MPLVAPSGSMDPRTRYAVLFQWDNSVLFETWIRVLFVEGLFFIDEAQTFLDLHAGRKTKAIRRPNPAHHFTGAVVATMIVFGPAPDIKHTHTIMHFSNAYSSMRYMSSYQWSVIRLSLIHI